MFIKREYLKYFNEIEQVEAEMIRRAKELQKVFEGSREATALVNTWLADEESHREIAQELIKIVKKR